jgi:hypothetical protein
VGDMAEWTLQQALDAEAEGYDGMDIELRSRDRKCAYCGQRGLHWAVDVNDKWRLYDERGHVHACGAYHEAKRDT